MPDQLSVEERAAALGWAPKEQWRGDPEKWVDAEEFVERGERIVPILKANNRQLETKVVSLEQTNRQLAQKIAEMEGAMGSFVEAQRDMLKDRLDQQRADIRRQLREAREAGDDAAIDRLEESLDANREQAAKLKDQTSDSPKEKKPSAAPTTDPATSAEFVAWQSANTWFGEDKRKTAMAMQLGREAAEKGLRNAAFFEYIDEEIAKVFGEPGRPTPKAEGGGPSGRGGPSGGKDAFSRLPADAQAHAKAEAKKFVGPNKIFKTDAEWYAHYAAQYGEV